MTIGIYADPLMTFTTAMPQREVLKKLINDKTDDHFIFFIHKRTLDNPVINTFFEQLKHNSNWQLIFIPVPYKVTRILQLVGFNYPRLSKTADVYFGPDIETFGKGRHPVINYLPDMSVFDDPQHTSLSKFSNYFRRSVIGRMSQASDCIIVISQFTADRFAAHFPSSKHKVRMVYSCIDDNWFKLPKQKAANSKKYWIWMGGSYNSRKNIDRMLLAYQQLLKSNLPKEIPNLILAGLDHDSVIKLTDVLEKMSLLQHVSLKSKISLEELVNLVDNSEGLVFPSIYEGFGLPVIEAFSRGKAVLTADKSSLVEVSGGKAILCNPYDIDSICNSMLEMLSSKNDDERLINERKEWASNFTYTIASEKIYSIFQQFSAKGMPS